MSASCASMLQRIESRDMTAEPAQRDRPLRKSAGDILLTFGRQLLGGLAGFGIAVVIGRALGVEGLGAYTVALLMPALLSQLLNLGRYRPIFTSSLRGKLTRAPPGAHRAMWRWRQARSASRNW